jgi:hypothetical protein
MTLTLPHCRHYQTYAFNALVNSDFRGLIFTCRTLANGACHCEYPSSLTSAGHCALRGEDVLSVSALHRCWLL